MPKKLVRVFKAWWYTAQLYCWCEVFKPFNCCDCCDCLLKTPPSGDTKPHNMALITRKHQNISISRAGISAPWTVHTVQTLTCNRGWSEARAAGRYSSQQWHTASGLCYRLLLTSNLYLPLSDSPAKHGLQLSGDLPLNAKAFQALRHLTLSLSPSLTPWIKHPSRLTM